MLGIGFPIAIVLSWALSHPRERAFLEAGGAEELAEPLT
jgi:hypothetical protein